MIVISIVMLLFSTLFQGLMSRYIGYTYNNLSIFSTIYVLITLLVLCPYFQNKKKFLILLIVFGLINDLLYTDVSLLNVCLFMLAYYISKVFHFFFPYNWLTISVSNLICIFVYHTISFAFLELLRYDNYSFFYLLKILGCSIISTFIYSIIVYYFVDFLNNRFQLKEIK